MLVKNVKSEEAALKAYREILDKLNIV
jgi:hypothetical protein